MKQTDLADGWCYHLNLKTVSMALKRNICWSQRQLNVCARVCSQQRVWGNALKRCDTMPVGSLSVVYVCVCVERGTSHMHTELQSLKVFDVCWLQFVVLQLWDFFTHSGDRQTHGCRQRRDGDQHRGPYRTEFSSLWMDLFVVKMRSSSISPRPPCPSPHSISTGWNRLEFAWTLGKD